MNHHRLVATLCVASLLGVAGCGGAATGTVPVSSVNPTNPNYSLLQFSVGTANLYGTGTGLNVVSTFRQNNGASATGVNTPTLTGPFSVNANAAPSQTSAADPYTTLIDGGPSFTEKNSPSAGITGTPQTITQGTPACDGTTGPGFTPCPAGLSPNTTSFGQSGGVFAMGLAPYNAVPNTGQAYSYAPYAQPIYGSTDVAESYTFVPWGGPPAFDPDGNGMGERDGLSINGQDSFGDPYFLGVGEGITAFDQVTPTSGTYTLAVAVATVGSGGGVTINTLTKTAKLNSGLVLPAITTPTTFTPDGTGGGTFPVVLPAGVTEAYLQVVDFGPGGGPNNGAATNVANCQSTRGTQFAPVYYTLHVTASGTVTLPDTDGPNTATSGGKTALVPGKSICNATDNGGTGDDIVVQLIGFDYPAYNAALGLTQNPTPQNPPIVGSAGQSDITIGQPVEINNIAGTTALTGAPFTRGRLRVAPHIHRIHR